MKNSIIAPLVLCLAGLVLTGCTTSVASASGSPVATAKPSSGSTISPKFGGPYAAELRDVYSKSRSEFERAALADGKVTDAEEAEMIERLRTCLASNGHRLDSFKKTGAHEITALNPDEEGPTGRKQIESCETYAGVNTVGLIYSAMLTDPQNIDLVPKIIACFKEHRLVDSGYGKSDYERALPSFSDEKKNAQVSQCNADPLNLTKGQ